LGHEFQPEYENLADEVQGRAFGDDEASSKIRATVKASARGYNEWFPTREHEGITF